MELQRPLLNQSSEHQGAYGNKDYQKISNQKKMIHSDDQSERDRFNNYFEYLLTVLGMAAGFGSVWRFPYLVYRNGGGVFLIPYFIMLYLVGIPSFYFETSLGQMFQKSAPQCFEMVHKKYKGLGIFPLILTFSMSTYYNLILAYSFYYLWQSFKSPLPWTASPDSATPWNTDYFYKDVLQFSDGIDHIGSIVWPLLFCYVISQLFVYICISKGVSVSGKVALFTATSPYILLILLLLRGLFLKGAWSGLAYLFMPDWSKLSSLQVWVDATNQAIFQVSTGGGVLLIFGSYRPRTQEIRKSTYIVVLLTVVCGLLAAMVIFSFMGYLSEITNTPINEIPLRGPDLTFIVFPAILTKMPFSNLLSVIFFVTMICLGIDTQFAFMDGVAGTIEDELKGEDLTIFNLKVPNKQIRAFVCGVVSLFSFLYCTQAGFYYLDLVDGYAVGFNLFVGLFIETFFFTWVCEWQNLEDKIRFYIQEPTPEIIVKLITYSVPIFTGGLGLMSLCLQFLRMFKQPWWCTMIGWTITLYPYYIIYYYYNKYKNEPYQQSQENIQQNIKQQSVQEMKEF